MLNLVKRIFHRPFTMTLNRVRDRLQIAEGTERLVLYVDSDPNRMVAALGQVQQQMQTLNNDSTPEQNQAAAAHFAQAIFGPDQAERIMAFYHGDAGCVINICGKYFNKRLGKKITKVQKKQRAEK